ncbi:MAG: AIR synthase-related protein, partial [Thiotrichaceae bacterium]
QTEGNIEDSEMLRTFNCGVGMTLVVAEEVAEDIINGLRLNDIDAWVIGHIEAANNEDSEAPFVEFTSG